MTGGLDSSLSYSCRWSTTLRERPREHWSRRPPVVHEDGARGPGPTLTMTTTRTRIESSGQCPTTWCEDLDLHPGWWPRGRRDGHY